MGEQSGNIEQLSIICPWCGGAMELVDDQSFYESIYTPSNKFWYRCKDSTCEAFSHTANTPEEAYLAALRRPMIKPLTLKELCNENRFDYDDTIPVIVESIGSEECFSAIFSPNNLRLYSVDMWSDVDVKGYNVTWRCWERKPTDEEREAAKWDD